MTTSHFPYSLFARLFALEFRENGEENGVDVFSCKEGVSKKTFTLGCQAVNPLALIHASLYQALSFQ